MPAATSLQVQPWFVLGVGNGYQFFIDTDSQPQICQFRALLAGGEQRLLVGFGRRPIGRRHLQRTHHIHLFRSQRQQETQPFACDADGVVAADDFGTGVFRRHFGRQHVIVGGHTGRIFAPGFVQMADFLGLIFQSQVVQFTRQQDVVIAGRNVPIGGLAVEPQLLVGGFKAVLGGPDRGVDLAPGVERL